MSKSRTEDWTHHTRRRHDSHADGYDGYDGYNSPKRERSPASRHGTSATQRRRSASPDSPSHRPHRSHHRRRDHKSRHADVHAKPESLPYSVRPLSKSDLRKFQPLFAYYLNIQKQKYLEDMDEREIRGRWKSFVGKWNRNDLAEGWYDPEMFAKCVAEYVPPESSIQPRGPSKEEPFGEEDMSPPGGPASLSANSDEDDYGPTLPSSSRRMGAKPATFQDLSLRNELLEEDRESRRQDLRQARKADRVLQKERLDELVPRAEPGTRERKLEKKKETNETMKQFREKSPGMEVGDGELMGGGDELQEYRRMKEKEKEKKSERQVRREEFERARREEMEERRRAWQEKEDGTVSMLRELAKQRFG
ncbi:hypothetical protein QQS21_011945 [Conoideocrella luteorostrata]|uniref:RNA helicase HEL117 n=1 Tax=Conoideocrella luteorostrata TaxID=1105319 RepID=A0AAJ0FSW3_9HYPO|nr:hypothetical protein QQS21_011945 [Conoideocrella luteorostrata]